MMVETDTARQQRRKINDTELRRLWSSHMTDCAIAAKLKHRVSVIRRRATKLGLPLRRELWGRNDGDA